MSTRTRTTARLVLVLLLALGPLAATGPAHAERERPGKPEVSLSRQEAGAGASVTVRGKGWRPKTLLTLLVCGQNAIGGTNTCSNDEGRAVTTGKDGTFRKRIPVTEPPKPCPCVVRATTVTGAHASADAAIKVAGHPVKPLPRDETGGRLTVLAARLDGDSGILNWFGAPEQRKLVLTVGNLGSERAKDPVFEVGTSHGVFAPKWERQQWRGTVDPGRKERIELPVELSSGAHGEYTVAAKHGAKVLTEQPWDVGRPWGVTLFWVLVFVVVPAAVFRLGMVAVDRVRPRQRTGAAPSPPPSSSRSPSPAPARAHAALASVRQIGAGRHVRPRPGRTPGPAPEPSPAAGDNGLPWFTPDTHPPVPKQEGP
ncbi:hypothetical protein GCM10009801_00470 [Streptomyces albiaxialis]|uniref:Neocarzinostatin family protein n=1 Tax=Streptomyces albiaxialis TaxID=329523 RepID=A0ABN2VD25_9ACTN